MDSSRSTKHWDSLKKWLCITVSRREKYLKKKKNKHQFEENSKGEWRKISIKLILTSKLRHLKSTWMAKGQTELTSLPLMIRKM